MKLLLRGHDDRYAVEQLQLALFPEEPMEPVTEPFSGDGAVSSLHTGAVWLTATAEITLHGKTGRACRRLRAAEADVPARRRLLQNTYYEAAMCLREPPAWGSLSGVRPTKLTTRALLEGKTPAEAEKLLRTRYHVSPERSRLCADIACRLLDYAEDTSSRGLLEKYRSRSLVLGREVTFRQGGAERTGKALKIDDRGCLVIETSSGIETLRSGEISITGGFN